MPLWLLIVLVVSGICAVALTCHRLGLTGGTPMTTGDAERAWLRHFPDDPVRLIKLAANGRAAGIETLTRHGIVWQMGADTVARYLDHVRIEPYANGLRLRFDEFSAPSLSLELSPDERDQWRHWMEAI